MDDFLFFFLDFSSFSVFFFFLNKINLLPDSQLEKIRLKQNLSLHLRVHESRFLEFYLPQEGISYSILFLKLHVHGNRTRKTIDIWECQSVSPLPKGN